MIKKVTGVNDFCIESFVRVNDFCIFAVINSDFTSRLIEYHGSFIQETSYIYLSSQHDYSEGIDR